MNVPELETYRQQLLSAQARLRGNVAHLSSEALWEGGGNLSHLSQHPADLASDAFEEDVTLLLLENQGQTLEEIREALDRLGRGDFGRCEECQGAIRPERLRALPHARHCLACARQLQGAAF